MTSRPKKLSPVLGAAATMIGDASESIVSGSTEFNHTFEVDVDAVSPDPAQARRSFDATSLANLASTLEAEGQLQPVLLRRDPAARNRWIIVAGERRWRAAKLLNWTKLLAMAYSGDADLAALLENLQRIDLSPIEEARGISRLLTEKGWTQDQAAKALGKPKSDVSGTLRILNLPEETLTQVLTSEHAPAKNVLVEMARISDPAALRRLAALARTGELTVRAIRAARAAPPPRDNAGEGVEKATATSDGWTAVRRARTMLQELAVRQTTVSGTEANLLRSLRNEIDRLLADASPP
jgi:ParB family chromosome partitioning protein